MSTAVFRIMVLISVVNAVNSHVTNSLMPMIPVKDLKVP